MFGVTLSIVLKLDVKFDAFTTDQTRITAWSVDNIGLFMCSQICVNTEFSEFAWCIFS